MREHPRLSLAADCTMGAPASCNLVAQSRTTLTQSRTTVSSSPFPNTTPTSCRDCFWHVVETPRFSLIGKVRYLGSAPHTNKKGRIGCPLATDPALPSKQDNRYLPEPTSAGNKPARALSCSAVVRFPEGCGAFWPFTATPSYLRASMILSSAAFIEIPLSQLMAAVPLFTATAPLKNAFRIPLLVA